MSNKTLDYYNVNAEEFAAGTIFVDFEDMQTKFLKKLPADSRILDYGCGSGRDTKFFLQQGFQVDAVDGSKELCKIASAYTGIDVKQMLFQELNENCCYDGIWACSSILHLPRQELYTIFEKMAGALKRNGIIYTSFKYGVFSGERNGRYFTDFTEELFLEFISGIKEITVEELWITPDVRAGRSDEKWLNLILRKK